MTDNLSRFTALDNAYNSRDWDAYSALLDDSFRGWMQGNAQPEGKAEHLRHAKSSAHFRPTTGSTTLPTSWRSLTKSGPAPSRASRAA